MLSVEPPLLAPGQTDYTPFVLALPHAGFNPTLLRWRGELLVAWRRGQSRARLWLGALQADYTLRWSREVDFSPVWPLAANDALEDPRLFLAGDRVHLACTHYRGAQARMALVELDESLAVNRVQVFENTAGRWEKNWQFFSHTDTLHSVYHTNPHAVGVLTGVGETAALRVPPAHGALHPWAWGQPRGGTPPVRAGDEYFSFFHSAHGRRYVAGFYAFEAQPPWRVTRWPTAPCLAPPPASGGARPLQVVFPGGAVLENGTWLLAYGWHDEACGLARFRHADLLATLQTVPLPPAATSSSRRIRDTLIPLRAPPVAAAPVSVPQLPPPRPGQPGDGAGCIFVLTVHQEPVLQVEWCLRRLRTAMPAARLVMLTDGPGRPEYTVLADAYGARFVAGEHLKTLTCGGRWLSRMLTEGLREPGEWIFKIDADAAVWRAFAALPDADFFGHLRDAGTPSEHIQGGCCGFRRGYAQRLLDSRVLDDPRWTVRAEWTLGPVSTAWVAAQGATYLSTDCLFMKAAALLGVPPHDWPETRHFFHVPFPENPAALCAVSHPHRGQRPPLPPCDVLELPAEPDILTFRHRDATALTGWAVLADDYEFLVRYVRARGLRRVAEFGPGDSTLAFLENDCAVSTFEHDAARLKAARVRFCAFPRVAVLPYEYGPGLPEQMAAWSADLVFVDGPPAGQEDAPARLWTCLAAARMAPRILLHDARRPGESHAARLMAALGWCVQFVPTEKGLFVMEAPPLAALARELPLPEIQQLHDERTVRWHHTSAVCAGRGLLRLVEENHRHNFLIWHEEDLARRDDLPAERIREAKRTIDRHNQLRNDAVEALDEALTAVLPRPPDSAPLHSESPGMMLDRLSIMALRKYHLEEKAAAPETGADLRAECHRRLELLRAAMQDLAGCLDELLAALAAGHRRFLPCRSLKLYNDPRFIPKTGMD